MSRPPDRLGAFPRAILVFGVAVVLSPLAGGGPDAARVRVVLLDQPAVEGPFSSLTAAGLSIGGGAPIPLDGIREIRFAADSAPSSAAGKGIGLRVILRGDESIRGAFTGGDADGIVLRPADVPPLRLPFEAIRCIEAESSSKGPCDEPARLHPARPGSDIAYTRSGDSFPGVVVGASEKGLVVENSEKKASTIAWADLVIAHLDVQGLPPTGGLAAEVETLDGSRLTATKVTGDAAGLTIATRAGVEVSAPLASLRVIRWTGGRFVYASDMPYTGTYTDYQPDDNSAAKKTWYGERSDRTPREGCPLQIAGTRYRHGIAVHARSVVTIPLDKKFTTFATLFGIDDALELKSPPMGDVTARVLVDGKPVWTSNGSVKGGEAARTVGPIDVGGADVLVLEVDFGGGLYTMDRGDWCDPILVRKP